MNGNGVNGDEMRGPGVKAPILAVKNLTTGYRHGRGRSRIVSNDLDLALLTGGVTALIGPNGCGKSTLLRTIAGLQPPLSGELFMDGRSFSAYTTRERARRIAVVLTGRSMPGHLTAAKLVQLGRYPHTNLFDRLTAEDRRAIEWALEASGANEYRERPVDELSDGELQKVMIARALAQEPRVILLDEPTAFLDVTRKLELMQLLSRIGREHGTAVLVSSHDLELVLQVAECVWLLNEQGDVRSGSPGDEGFLAGIKRTFRIPDSYRIHNGMAL